MFRVFSYITFFFLFLTAFLFVLSLFLKSVIFFRSQLLKLHHKTVPVQDAVSSAVTLSEINEVKNEA